MMEQITLDNISECDIKAGGLLMWTISFWKGFTRAVMYDGELCLEEYMHGKNKPIHSFLEDAPYCKVFKITLDKMEKTCKENGWDVDWYMDKFGRKETE